MNSNMGAAFSNTTQAELPPNDNPATLVESGLTKKYNGDGKPGKTTSGPHDPVPSTGKSSPLSSYPTPAMNVAARRSSNTSPTPGTITWRSSRIFTRTSIRSSLDTLYPTSAAIPTKRPKGKQKPTYSTYPSRARLAGE